MSFQDFANRIQLIADEIEATREQETVIQANDLFALIRRRIQKNREDSTGSSFGNYSLTLVPKYWGEKNAITDGGRERIRKGNDFQSYTDFRKADGLQVDSIDFTRTGHMFQQSGVNSIETTNFITKVGIGGQTDYAQRLIGYHNERFGNIYAPTEDEIQMVLDAQRERIENIFNTFL